MKEPSRSARHGISARNKVRPTVPKTAEVRAQPRKIKGLTAGSSQASSVSGLSLRRKSAFDDETTNPDHMTFVTSTTDYLEGGKHRNLHGSFDSQNSPQRNGASSAAGSYYSEGSGMGARERKRLQERGWENGRHKQKYSDDAYHDYESNAYESSQMMQSTQPRSSRQLGSSGLPHEKYGRDGYDSDSYSQKPNRQGDFESSFLESTHADNITYADSTYVDTTTTKEGGNGRKSVASYGNSFMAESEGKIKMTKMEKIKQMQAKNEKYKEEYKKTYLEKKEFKKKYEDKKMEVVSLTSEIESYMRETALLKQQLSVLTNDMDHAEDNTRHDLATVQKLQKELQNTRADLKEALGRIADRKMETAKLQEVMKRKDDQIETLTLEVSRQIQQLQDFQAQVSVLDMGSAASTQATRGAGRLACGSGSTDGRVKELQEENITIKAELEVTLDRAAEMVKNREHTIEILRKENCELKELLDIRDQDDDRTTTSEKVRAKKDAMEALQVEIKGLRELCSENEANNEDLKQVLKSREAELRHLKGDIDGLKKMVKRAEKDAQAAREDAEERQSRIASLEAKIGRLQNQTKGVEQEFEKANEVMESRDEQIRRLENEIKQLQESKDESNDELDAAHERLEEKEEEIKGLFRENEDLKAEILQQKNALEERRKNVVLELEDLKLTEQKLNEEARESSKKIKARDEAIEDLLREVDKLKSAGSDKGADYSKDLKKHEFKLMNLTKDAEAMKKELNDKDAALEQTQNMVKEREEAIADLLRDIEALKAKGSDGEQQISTRMEELNLNARKQNNLVENLQSELDELTKRLDEKEYNLAAKTDSLREREEEVELLLEEIKDLKNQHEQEKLENNKTKQSADTFMLENELSKVRDHLKTKEMELQQLVQENMKLNESVENMQKEKEESDQADEVEDEKSQVSESKSFMAAQHEVLEEEIQQLNEQVVEIQEELDDVHRQNAILNEEVEDWHQRGGNFELEIQRLRNQLEECADRSDLDVASVGGNSTGELGDKQAMLLEKAMAERQRKAKGDGKGVWGLIFNKSEEDEELTEDQKRIKELEAIKDAQAAEIQKIKSDLVKLTTSTRNETYVDKKKIADLEEENDAYKAKVHLLLKRLSQAQGIPYDDDDAEEKKLEDP